MPKDRPVVHSKYCQWTPSSLFGCSCGRTDMKPIDDDNGDWDVPL
jgi:hypothetical protein